MLTFLSAIDDVCQDASTQPQNSARLLQTLFWWKRFLLGSETCPGYKWRLLTPGVIAGLERGWVQGEAAAGGGETHCCMSLITNC